MRSTKDVPQPWLESLFRPVMCYLPPSDVIVLGHSVNRVGTYLPRLWLLLDIEGS